MAHPIFSSSCPHFPGFMELILIPSTWFRLFFGFPFCNQYRIIHMRKYQYPLLNINLLENNLRRAPYARPQRQDVLTSKRSSEKSQSARKAIGFAVSPQFPTHAARTPSILEPRKYPLVHFGRTKAQRPALLGGSRHTQLCMCGGAAMRSSFCGHPLVCRISS